MASKSKESRLEQKAYWEEKLNQRLSLLSENTAEPAKTAKDPAVKKIRAKIRETEARLRAITTLEKKAEEMAKAKADKLAAPKKEKGKKQEASAGESKRQQKKKKKKEAKATEP